ncbi:MAG: glutathione synthase [Proteobacteria bacterium]|nr:glutathione synthase [Pseudomonadota bacterium]
MHIVVIMDPPSSVVVAEDTSFALLLEAQAREHRIDHCLLHELFLRDGRLWAHARPARMLPEAICPIELGIEQQVCLHDVDAVLIRSDPPFDSAYLWATLMLERLRGQTLVVNDPRGLREANEKLYACWFPELMPETLVTSHSHEIRRFVRDVGGRAVIKPLHGKGGEGVMALFDGDLNQGAIVEATTDSGRRLAIVQRYLPEVTRGDKRILVLDGEPLGVIARVPQQGELRANIHVGATVVRASLEAADRRIVDSLAPRLRQDGLSFVGLDVIGGRLTEVNVTSPTGIVQMSRLSGSNLPARVMDWLEAACA